VFRNCAPVLRVRNSHGPAPVSVEAPNRLDDSRVPVDMYRKAVRCMCNLAAGRAVDDDSQAADYYKACHVTCMLLYSTVTAYINTC
jgi:hypothetical protein